MQQTIDKKTLKKLRDFYGSRRGHLKVIVERTNLSRSTIWATLYKDGHKNEDALDAMVEYMKEFAAEADKKRKEREKKLSEL